MRRAIIRELKRSQGESAEKSLKLARGSFQGAKCRQDRWSQGGVIALGVLKGEVSLRNSVEASDMRVLQIQCLAFAGAPQRAHENEPRLLLCLVVTVGGGPINTIPD